MVNKMSIACQDCRIEYGILFEEELPNRPGFYANRTEPAVLPIQCPACLALAMTNKASMKPAGLAVDAATPVAVERSVGCLVRALIP